MNFSERVYEDIGEVVGEFGFPAVIKSVNFRKRDAQHPEDEYIQDSLKLPRGSITLLERKLTLQFAHVTVIQFRDPDKIKKEKGIEFIESHKELEDKDYLLPLTYEGKCKIVHPPGKRKRYVDVTELIKDIPRWIRINDQLISLENEEVEVIHPGDVLEIVGVKKIDKERCLVCRNKNQKSIMINESIPVNITAVDDTNDYTLKDLTSSVYLPKYIEFEDICPYDIIVYDDILAQQLLMMTSGTVKVNCVVEQKAILGWCLPRGPNGSTRAFRTVIIPKCKWNHQKFKVRKFINTTHRMQYVKKHFPKRKDSEYMNHKLYLMDAGCYPGIVWLQNRHPSSEMQEPENRSLDNRRPSDERPLPLEVEKEELPDSDLDDGYEEPLPKQEQVPTLPQRQVLLPQRVEKPDQWKDVLEKIQLKAKNGFDKVHAEIRSLFGKPPPLYPRPTVRDRNLSEGCEPARNADDIDIESHDTQETQTQVSKLTYSSSFAGATRPLKKKEAKRAHSTTTSTDKSVSKNPESSKLHPNEVSEKKMSSDEDNASSGSQKPLILKRPPLPLPEVPDSKNERQDTDSPDYEIHDYDYPDVRELSKKGYVGIDVAEADRVSRDGQTAEDFYDYTVDEVVSCFRIVAQPEMADKCRAENLDGKFFESLSEEEIKTYFSLDCLHFLKVKKAIFDGWRPR